MQRVDDFIVALMTASSADEAERISAALVEKRLAACCNIVKGVTSIYEWKGKLEKGEECLVIIKTRRELFEKLSSEIRSLHSYEVPEIIALPMIAGFEGYLDWIKSNTQ